MLNFTYSCPEDWNKMQPNAEGKFCSLCQEQVIDFTDKSNEEILAIIKNKGKTFCAKTNSVQLNAFNRYATKQKFNKSAAAILLGLLLVSCNPAISPLAQTQTEQTESSILSDDIISTILQSIPNPLETSALVSSLEKNKAIFMTQKLRPIIAIENLSKEQLGFLYGQYCVNLYYAYICNEKEIVQKYYAELQKIEKLLGLDSINKNKALIDNLLAQKNEDALLNAAQQNFERFNTYNREHHQEVVNTQILAGVFLEANYFLTVIYEDTKEAKLKTSIGEQKITIEQIVLVLDMFNKAKTTNTYADFKKLQEYYTKVQIVTKQEPMGLIMVTDEIKVVESSPSDVIVSDKDLKQLCQAIQDLRGKYVQ